MTVETPTGPPTASDDRARRLGFAASALLIFSALLQAAAATQRWVSADASLVGADRTIEDHLFDYVIPADPWVSLGSAATMFGIGYLLISAALVCLGAALRASGVRGWGVLVVAVVAALPFVVLGVHAVVSGVSAVASPLQQLTATYGALVLGAIQAIALAVLAALAVRRSWVWATGVVLLIGATLIGYVWALFYVAPVLVGYQSYDTTPWTEGVLAASTAAAAVAILIGSVRLRPAVSGRTTQGGLPPPAR